MKKFSPSHPKRLPKSNTFYALLLILLCFVQTLHAQSEEEKRLFQLMNSEREREGIDPLTWDDGLYHLALEHSTDMASRNELTHAGSDGSSSHDRFVASGLYASHTGENVARDTNLVTAHTSFLDSIGHRENILQHDFTHGAVAIASREHYFYITQVFATLLPDYDLEEARDRILKQINGMRTDSNLPAVTLDLTFNSLAQNQADTYAQRGSITPGARLTLSPGRGTGAVSTDAYTTGNLDRIPREVALVLKRPGVRAGVGFRRVRGPLCDIGCYLVTVVSQ